jgi:hypothetical protein
LEHFGTDDAAVIQLVYKGDAKTPITATATVKGQHDIKEIPSSEVASPTSQQPLAKTLSGQSLTQKIFALVVSVLICFMLIFFIRYDHGQNHSRSKRALTWIFLFLMLGYFLFNVYVLFTSAVRLPLDFCGSCGASAREAAAPAANGA